VLKSLVDNFPIETIRRTAAEKLNALDQIEIQRLQKMKSDTLENER
jgi:hypothetical protein